MTLDVLVEELETLKQDLPASSKRFEETLAQIAALNDLRCIGLLVRMFPDNANFSDLMFSVVHTMERFPDDIYATEIVRALSNLRRVSPYWTMIIHIRIFNNPETFAVYKSIIAKCDSEQKRKIRAVLSEIAANRAEVKTACEEALKVL